MAIDKTNDITDNVAIEAIQNDLEWHSKELKPKYKRVLEYAIQAIKERKAYQDIGSVEEFRELKANKKIDQDRDLER